MPTPQRKHESSVIQRLLDEPHRFSFAQAVSILLRWLRQQGIPDDRAFSHVLRFQNSLSLAFPASEIEALQVDSGDVTSDVDLQLALQRIDPVKIRMTPAFIGVLGASGALPLHHTECFASVQPRQSDASARAFLDIFSNRMVGLFYQAWGKYRVGHKLDTRGQDNLKPMLMALAGTRAASITNVHDQDAVTDDPIAYYAALLRTRPVSASTIGRVLTEYFNVPVRLEEFVGCWDPIPARSRSTLGNANARLGFGAVLGVRLWRHDLRVRLCIGPLDEQQLARFLPNGPVAKALDKMLTLFAVPHIQYEVQLILSPACIKPLTLSTKEKSTRQRLGWDTFLTSVPGKATRPDVRYMASGMSYSRIDASQHKNETSE